jgi:hypothetical protein
MVLLFSLVVMMLLAGCAREGVLVVAFDIAKDESAWFPIDVANWTRATRSNGDTYYYYTVNDATADLQAVLVDPGSGKPSDSRLVHLDSYTVTWQDSLHRIPRLTGALDLTVPADPGSSKPARFTLLVLPASEKEALPVLNDLRGDPTDENPDPFNGQLLVKAKIDIQGHDLATDDAVFATMSLTAAFADYPDPNNYH